MRKITQNAANAFIAGRPFASGNTTVTVEASEHGQTVKMFLHGNLIAYRNSCKHNLYFSLAGWPTVTTRERINGLLTSMNSPCFVFQKAHEQRFGNHNYSDPISANQWVAC